MNDKKPIPLHDNMSLPVLPAGHLPKPVIDWCNEISRCLGVCPTMPIGLATAVVSGLIQKNFQAEIYPGYVEPLPHYACVIAAPGERKTATMKAIMGPINEYAKANRFNWMAEDMLRAGRSKAAATRIAAASKCDNVKASDIASDVALAAQEGGTKQFVMEDFTTAALVNTMTTNNSVLIATDEGEFWKRIGGGHSEDIGLLLRGHTAEPYAQNRKGDKKPAIIERPVISIAVSMQPSVLASSNTDAMIGQGLLARFFVTIPESKLGKFDTKYHAFDPAIRGRYAECMGMLCNLLETDANELVSLSATEGAITEFEEFKAWCMWESRGDDQAREYIPNTEAKTSKLMVKTDGPIGKLFPILNWSSKLSGAAIRIASIQAAYRAFKYSGQAAPQITSNDACHAINFCMAAVEHTLAVQRMMRGDNWMASKRAIEIIESNGWPTEPISIGRLANIIEDCADNRKSVDDVINNLCDKEWFIRLDGKYLRTNSNLIQSPLQLEEQ